MQTNELREAIQKREGVEWEVAEQPDVETGLGYLPSEGVPPLADQLDLAASFAAEGPPPTPSYPPAIDLRQTSAGNMITPIRSQGACGSCVAFATSAAVEGTLRVQSGDAGLELDLSEAYLFYCKAASEGRNCGPGPQGGWQPAKALDVFKDGGVPDESCFPYTSGDQACAVSSDWEGKAATIADWRKLNTPAEMKEWLPTRGPIVASMAAYEDLRHYAGGVYSHVVGELLGGHCICVVGYDDEQSFWIVKNSWGDIWGEGGFFRIAYGQCGIDSGMLGIEEVRPPASA
jgi:C1A family cysteine protease